MNNSKELIKNYLVNNRDSLITILKPYIDQRDSLLSQLGTEFTKDIMDQFEYVAKRLLIDNVSSAMIDGLTPEDILIDISSLNLKYYIESDIIDIQKEDENV